MPGSSRLTLGVLMSALLPFFGLNLASSYGGRSPGSSRIVKTGRVSHCCSAAFTSAGVSRGILVERLLVEVGIARVDLALGQRDGLAAEAADLSRDRGSGR